MRRADQLHAALGDGSRRRRFELVDAHWDVPVADVEMG